MTPPSLVIELNNIVLRFDQFGFNEPINWHIHSNQHWAITGANGAGKSMLIDILTGKYALHYNCKIICKDENGSDLSIRQTIKSVAFKDIYSLVDVKDSYYQQRWNKGLEEQRAKVKDIVANSDQQELSQLVEWFAIEDLMEKEINLLSSGELRKFLIIRSLLSSPRILILDNPYIGLDDQSRLILNELFDKLIRYKKLHIFLIVPEPNEIPAFVTHVLAIKDKKIVGNSTRKEFFANPTFIHSLFEDRATGHFPKSEKSHTLNFENAINLKNIHIKYGARTILKDLDWKIKKGEKWALLGANGSGKSTLLSLICGDNPQAYANDITLFDVQRGTGESIWDIKKRIGYISPEMHLYYLKNVPCLHIVGSGYFDTIGLYRKCSTEQEAAASEWMKLFGIEHLQDVSFLNISTGEQRLVLLARVLVKNPDLLILDEPTHGLDIANKKKVKQIIEDFCGQDKTLIYVTHYKEEIPSIVDKELVLTKNK